MLDRKEIRRRKLLAAWLLLNSIIFLACYLNYRLHLKHRYLYKTLSVGLCFSRAAAMVINFNLLLVWIPMCKYSLTKLAYLANKKLNSSPYHRAKLPLEQSQQHLELTLSSPGGQQGCFRRFGRISGKVSRFFQLKFDSLRQTLLSEFIVAVENCTSLHTILASTIALASSNLNMAQFKGQHPLALLNSVPGITGAAMVLILGLMSLSSLKLIRNSSFDLFQILHRLSILFVILLLVHPQRPTFVAQSSVSAYFLITGLLAYLADLYLRKRRRSRSPIELLGFRCEQGSNSLLELTLSNNHKRFKRWQAGQFVYLNCPQIARFEWHPFTISSMDDSNRCFSLHIKRSGDWTQRLAELLLQVSNSPKLMELTLPASPFKGLKARQQSHLLANILAIDQQHACHHWTPISVLDGQKDIRDDCSNGDAKPSLEEAKRGTSEEVQDQQRRPSIGGFEGGNWRKFSNLSNAIELFVDGPFHSPFERLLEQQVSICVASGVGWTAFSSLFQTLNTTSSLEPLAKQQQQQRQQQQQLQQHGSLKLEMRADFRHSTCDQQQEASSWWTRWPQFAITKQRPASQSIAQFVDSHSIGQEQEQQQQRQVSFPGEQQSGGNLHLAIIVADVEQLRPFYSLASGYFKRLQASGEPEKSSKSSSLVREINVFLTRCRQESQEVGHFCKLERLESESGFIKVNALFRIHFGRPELGAYLDNFRHSYPKTSKISVYCCGSHEVKKSVRAACKELNLRQNKKKNSDQSSSPGTNHHFSYHEESF